MGLELEGLRSTEGEGWEMQGQGRSGIPVVGFRIVRSRVTPFT